jgi:intracellular multiplication protein IcmD
MRRLPTANSGSMAATEQEDCLMGNATPSLGSIAESITSSFSNLSKLVTAGSYLAGLAFSIGAIMKFKQHKDNPTQTPIGTPVAMIVIAAALTFLPSLMDAKKQASNRD